jgi:hypothetical protein
MGARADVDVDAAIGGVELRPQIRTGVEDRAHLLLDLVERCGRERAGRQGALQPTQAAPLVDLT